MSLEIDTGAPAVAVENLAVSYGPTVVFDRIGFAVPTGTALALVGENGTGKSTLLRCVGGLQQPTGGDVRVFGKAPAVTAGFWRHVVTTVESPSWYHGLTVREHLELVRVANGEPPDDSRLDYLCSALGMDGLGGSLPSTLSAGQRQRFLLTAVLGRSSRLMLLDEPEQHLDAMIKEVVASHLAAYVAAGGTLVMASHDEDLVMSVGATTFVVGSAGSR